MSKLLLVTFFVTGLLFQPLTYAETKVGYMNLQRAIQGTKSGKKAKKRLEKEFKKRKKNLAKKESNLQKMGENLRKKKVALSQKAYYKKLEEFEKERRNYQQILQKNQFEIQKKERELTAPILKKLEKVVEKIAKKEGYSIVLDKSEQRILWGKKELDITDKVIKSFDRG